MEDKGLEKGEREAGVDGNAGDESSNENSSGEKTKSIASRAAAGDTEEAESIARGF